MLCWGVDGRKGDGEMEKYGYVLEETLKFKEEIILKTDLSERELIDEMEEAERSADSAEDVAMLLDRVPGIKVIKFPDSDYSSPHDVEVEYYDHVELGEGE